MIHYSGDKLLDLITILHCVAIKNLIAIVSLEVTYRTCCPILMSTHHLFTPIFLRFDKVMVHVSKFHSSNFK